MNSNSKRIAKNTAYLYLRMALLLFISLYTSRVMLDKLGVENYGIYNVVGGLAGMFLFFRSSLSTASQRFLNIRLGTKDYVGACRILQQHLTLYLILAVVVVIMADTIGLWFLHHKLVIPDDRMYAAEVAFHLCVASLATTLLSIVFDAEVVSNEDMKVYSIVGVVEGFLKLAICYMLVISPFDSLITYAVLLFIVSTGNHLFFMFYSLKKYQECRIGLLWDKELLKETGNIVGWDMYGAIVWMFNDQGINILLNMFFGPVVNAARGVSLQVNSALSNFTNSIYTPLRPQIMKNYAAGDFEYMHRLFYSGTKYSLYVLWIIGLPLILSIDTILHLWLKEVPDYTNAFTILVICYSFIGVLHSPLLDIAMAAGNLKKYMLIGCSIFLLVFPVSYFVLALGYSPVSVFVVMIIIRSLFYLVSLGIVSRIGKFSIREYVKKVFIPFLLVALPSLTVCCFVSETVSVVQGKNLLLFIVISIIVNALLIWLLGLNKNEKSQLLSLIPIINHKE